MKSMKCTRVIIAGGRDFDDYDLMAAKMDQVLEKFPDMIVISGGAIGAYEEPNTIRPNQALSCED